MNLYIITRGRAGNMLTLNSIPPSLAPHVRIVCPPDEWHHYRQAHPGWEIITSPATTYSEKVQWTLRLIGSTHRKGVIIDDDLWFDTRDPDNWKRMVKINHVDELIPMWEKLWAALTLYPLVGVHPRMMGQNAPQVYKLVGKHTCVHGVNLELFPDKLVPKVDYHPVLADVFLVCHILSHGLQNCLLTDWVVNWGPSQAPGGCDYRTLEMQRLATAEVADMYHPFAKQVWKKAKQENWLGEDGRWDLRVQWKKLYEWGVANAGTE